MHFKNVTTSFSEKSLWLLLIFVLVIYDKNMVINQKVGYKESHIWKFYSNPQIGQLYVNDVLEICGGL